MVIELQDTEPDLRSPSPGSVRRGPAEALRGRTVGKYVLEVEIGSGGMGRVYRARHASLGHPVAVKLCLDLTENAYRSVLREGRAMASLRDPHVVRVLDVEVEAGLGPYLVMELLEGESLQAVLARGPLPAERARRIALDLAFALRAAHAAALVHRDLKPGNVMVETTLRGEQAKVLDFGIVKALSSDAPSSIESVLAGTPLYMSPEQWRAEGITAQSDVWSFGVVLFEMLTGRLPFEAKSPWELCVLVNDGTARRVRTLDSTLDPALDALVADCLQRDPTARPTAAELVRRLGHETTAASGLPLRHRARAATWAGALLLTGLAAAWLARSREASPGVASSPSAAPAPGPPAPEVAPVVAAATVAASTPLPGAPLHEDRATPHRAHRAPTAMQSAALTPTAPPPATASTRRSGASLRPEDF
ncbi:MAG: serine/threonine protein kinase [Proteobacteria bacterium]|nr:MAG: serine/threonine protein kinase [Pseudomonadota bacterium]